MMCSKVLDPHTLTVRSGKSERRDHDMKCFLHPLSSDDSAMSSAKLEVKGEGLMHRLGL